MRPGERTRRSSPCCVERSAVVAIRPTASTTHRRPLARQLGRPPFRSGPHPVVGPGPGRRRHQRGRLYVAPPGDASTTASTWTTAPWPRHAKSTPPTVLHRSAETGLEAIASRLAAEASPALIHEIDPSVGAASCLPTTRTLAELQAALAATCSERLRRSAPQRGRCRPDRAQWGMGRNRPAHRRAPGRCGPRRRRRRAVWSRPPF